MDRKKQIGLGVLILLIIIGAIVGFKILSEKKNGEVDLSKLTTVYVATGGGKEDFLADEDIVRIMQQRYGLNVVYDSWSNGKLIKNELVREDGTKYDLMFTSDQRFYDYYKLAPDASKGEAKRNSVLNGGLILNTPIVIYSWDTVVDALIKENIVTQKEGVYYITDMNKLIDYILQGKTWKDIGLDMLYGSINIDSTDPVTSSPGATYYGLLLSIMCQGNVTEVNMRENLPKLKEFYTKSGYMNNTPADLFEMYLKTGVGGKPMIVDYEKSMIEFANSNPDGWNQVKDKVRILYPVPTIWNSHCIASFDNVGNQYYKAYEDKEISQIAWSKYGFRTGVTGGNYDVKSVGITGIPQSIDSTVSSLRMNMYEELIDYLK